MEAEIRSGEQGGRGGVVRRDFLSSGGMVGGSCGRIPFHMVTAMLSLYVSKAERKSS